MPRDREEVPSWEELARLVVALDSDRREDYLAALRALVALADRLRPLVRAAGEPE